MTRQTFLLVKKLSEEAGGDCCRYCVDIRGERAILADFHGFCAHGVVGLLCEPSGLKRNEQVDALASAKKLDGENVLEIAQHSFEAAGATHAHGDVIFLITAGGDGIDGVRRCESLILAGESGGGDLGNHEPGIEAGLWREKCRQETGERVGHLLDAAFGNSAECRDGDRYLIGGHCEGLPVKIPATDDVAFSPLAIAADKDERIVSGTVEFNLCHGARLRKGVAHRAVDLRRATEAVGVLHAGIFFRRAMRFANFAAFVQMGKISGSAAGARVSARVHDARIESAGTAAKRVERKGCGNVGGVRERVSMTQRQAEQGQHALCAVQEGKALLGVKGDGRDLRALQRNVARQDFLLEFGLAFSDDHLREMSQRREIARSAHGTLRRNHRMNSGVEHCAKRFYRAWPDAAESFCQSICTKKHDGASFGFTERFANSAGMGANQIYLELANLFGGDADTGKFAETCVAAVSSLAGGYQSIDHSARGVHAFRCDTGERNVFILEGDRVQLIESEIVSVQLNCYSTRRRHTRRLPSADSGTSERNLLRYFCGNSFGFPSFPQITWVVAPEASK